MHGNRLNLTWCRWPSLARVLLAWVILSPFTAGPAGVAWADEGGVEAALADEPGRLLAMAGDEATPTADRKAAAVTLLERDDTDAVQLLDVVLPLLSVIEPAGQRELGERLARRASDELVTTLIARARDTQLPEAVRRGAVLALGRQPVQSAAEVLVELTAVDTAEPIRRAAFTSLATLTGRADRDRDTAAWQAWWQYASSLSPRQWQQHLLEGHARQRREARGYQQVLESRLVEAHRSLFRTVSVEDRPAQLMRLLEDPLEVVRQLGMDLAVQRLVDDRPFDEPLRETLRARLDDPSPAIRQRATLLLRDLADGPAADRVARRLAEDVEHVESVLRAELLMMSRLPRIEAVERSLELLANAALRDEAAGALNAAVDADRLTYQQGVRALRRVREQLDGGSPPLPSIVLLLGRLGDEQDWQRIEGWLDAADDAVKQAAARAWAESDRPLLPLVERAGDGRIESIALLAAARRGERTETFRALVRFEPNGEQSTERWQRALESMAGRVPGDVVLAAVRELEQRGVSTVVGRRMLAAALEQVEASSRSSAAEQRAALLLARGRLRLASGEPEAALNDFDRLERLEVQLSATQREQRQRGIIRARLGLEQFDRAIAAAEALVRARAGGAAGEADAAALALRESDSPMDLLLEAADERAASGDAAALEQLVEGLRQLAGESPDAGMVQRLDRLEGQLSKLRNGASEEDGHAEPIDTEATEAADADPPGSA